MLTEVLRLRKRAEKAERERDEYRDLHSQAMDSVDRLKRERDELRDGRQALREWLAIVGELESYDRWRRGVLAHREEE